MCMPIFPGKAQYWKARVLKRPEVNRKNWVGTSNWCRAETFRAQQYMGNSRLSKICESSSLPVGSQTQTKCWWISVGKAVKCNATLVGCGDFGNAGVSCKIEPVIDLTKIRVILSISAQSEWELHQIDGSKAVFQSALDWEVYMVVP